MIWALLVLFPLALAADAFKEVNGARRIRAGHDVIARWAVSPKDWQSFVAFDAARSEHWDNLAWIGPGRRSGVEIVFARSEVMVDGQWYQLQGVLGPSIFHVAWIDVRPACLEIAILIGADSASLGVLRVPVPEASVAAGRRIFNYFNNVIPGTAVPPKRLFGYDRAEGVAARYRPKFDTTPQRLAAGRISGRLAVSGAFFALVGIGMAVLAGYQASQGTMDPNAADLLILIGASLAILVTGVTAFLCIGSARGRVF